MVEPIFENTNIPEMGIVHVAVDLPHSLVTTQCRVDSRGNYQTIQ